MEKIEIVNTPPSNYEYLKRFFPSLDFYRGDVITYDGKIHSYFELSESMLEHEKTHLKQQSKMGADVYVEKYIKDPKFRLDVELEAYRAEYRFMRCNSKYRSKLGNELKRLAVNLSGPLYNGLLTTDQAMLLIKF